VKLSGGRPVANLRTIYLAGGCFWGLEDLFREEPGVTDTEVGYSGGENDNPTYESHPGHAETLAITFDTDKTSFENILDFFFRIHDPTTRNRQGNDIGSSYRSAIFYQNDKELKIAEEIISTVNASGLYKDGVVTTLEPFEKFWTAEEYHQDYLRKNPGGYTCHYLRTNESLLTK
jgi:peptide-methionine (S)-S-oxide reductase